MTLFGGMLKDEEIANLFAFVRNSYGNRADPVYVEEGISEGTRPGFPMANSW